VWNALIEAGADGICLCGTMLADGLGEEASFERWKESFVVLLCRVWPSSVRWCLEGWQASRQDERLGQLGQYVQSLMPILTIGPWLRLVRVCIQLGWQVLIEPEPSHPIDFARRWFLDASIQSPQELAAGRVLSSSHPLWPGEPLEVALLQLWPSPRRLLGITLQAAVLCGATRADLLKLLQTLYRTAPDFTEENKGNASRLAFSLASDLFLNFHDPLVPQLSTDWAWQLAGIQAEFSPNHEGAKEVEFATQVYQRDWLRPWVRDVFGFVDEAGQAQLLRRAAARAAERGRVLTTQHDLRWALPWSTDWACTQAPMSARDLAEHWGISEDAAWLEDLGRFLYHGSARFGTRGFVAMLKNYGPPANLVAHACRLALRPEEDPADFDATLESYPQVGDPLWPSLARHLAGRSTPADRTFLEQLLRHPERKEGPLSWGLRYLARGDVILNDGSEATLDDLAAEAGMPPIPLLEAMPPPPNLLSEKQLQQLSIYTALSFSGLPTMYWGPCSIRDTGILRKAFQDLVSSIQDPAAGSGTWILSNLPESPPKTR
jgi:hypothetical protein